MKRVFQLLCAVIVTAILLAIPVSANENVTRASAFFVSHRTYLYEVEGNEFGVWFEVVAKRSMDELGVSYIEVQRSSDQNTWTTVATYYPEDHEQMIGTDTAFYADGVTYTGTSGYYYQACVTYYAKSGNSVGYYDTYSDIMRL